MWFALLGGLGAVSVMTRAVPEFTTRGDTGGLRRLLSQLLTVRAGTGVLGAAAYVALAAWRVDVDAASIAFVAAALFTRTTANICFALFLGLNQAARWGLGETLRRTLTVVFVLAGAAAGGLRGACAGYFAAHVVTLGAGLWMSRDYLRWSLARPDLSFLRPYLRTGVAFTAGNVMLSLSQRTGEALVHVSTGSFPEVGYFGVAYGLYLAGAQVVWHFSASFAPMLVGWHARGDRDAVGRWIRRLLLWTATAAASAAAIVWFFGEAFVRLALGDEYVLVAASLRPLAVAGLAVAVSSAGRVAALVENRPGSSAAAAGLELATFWILGAPLASAWGSAGASWAACAGATANALWMMGPGRARTPPGSRSAPDAPVSPSW
jgi:O-antigen/teichoic acid export membrane protein